MTKIKALQAFRSYIAADCAAVDGDNLEAVLGTWAYYFQRLVIDNSKKVRLEASHAHWEILLKVSKRDLQAALPR